MKAAGQAAGLALVLAWVVGPGLLPVQAQEVAGPVAPAGWAFGVTGMIAHWGEGSDPFDRLGGPALEAAWVPTRGVGFDIRAGYQMPTGFYDMSGIWAHGVLALSLPAGRHLMQLEGGASGFLADDSDGSVWAAGGPLAGVGALIRPRGRLGLRISGFAQVLVTSEAVTVSPGMTAGILLLPATR